MKKQELKYTFHNPNTMGETANHLLKVFVETNANRVETLIRTAANKEDT